jgi:hypothetical protein
MTHPDGITVEIFDSMGDAARRIQQLTGSTSEINGMQRKIARCLKKPGEKDYSTHYLNFKFM